MKVCTGLCLSLFSLLSLLSCTQQQHKDVLIGYVESDYLYVAAPQSGWLRKMDVKDGQQIPNQHLLFSLDQDSQQLLVNELEARLEEANAKLQDLSTGSREPEITRLRAQLKEASANLMLAELEQQRVQKLVTQKLVSEEEADKAIAQFHKAQAFYQQVQASIEIAQLASRPAQIRAAQKDVKAIEAQLQQVKWQLQQRNVFAQQPARVVDLLHFEGEFVNAGQPVVVLETPQQLNIRFFVPQKILSRLTLGQIMTVKSDGQRQAIKATISYIANEAEYTPPVLYTAGPRQKLVFMIEAIPATIAGLHPGLPVEVVFDD